MDEDAAATLLSKFQAQLADDGFITRTTYMASGTYASVLKGTDVSNGQRVALKTMMCSTTEPLPCMLLRELRALTSLSHPNIVTMDRILIGDGIIGLQMPLFDCSLTGLLKRVGYLDAPVVAYIAREVAVGMSAAADAGIMHRDLKPCNILLKDRSVVVADWGLSRDLRDTTPGMMSGDVITLWYAPPEVICGQRTYGHAADVWSFGMSMLDMLAGRSLYKSVDRGSFMTPLFQLIGNVSLSPAEELYLDRIMPASYPRMKDFLKTTGVLNTLLESCATPAAMVDLLKRTLAILPEERPSWHEILEHPALQDIADVALTTRPCVMGSDAPLLRSSRKRRIGAGHLPSLICICTVPRQDTRVVLGWNRGGVVSDAELYRLTTFCVKKLGSCMFRPFLMAMRLSWLVTVDGPAVLLACVSVAFAALGNLYLGRACGDHDAPFDCNLPGAIQRLEMVVLKETGASFPPMPEEWQPYMSMTRRGQLLAMYLWSRSGVEEATISLLCSDYDLRIPNPEVVALIPQLRMMV
jgi:serine/threonine protein kinase